MKHGMPSLHVFRLAGRRLSLPVGLILAVTQGHPSLAADAPETAGGAAVHLSPKCDKTPTEIDRLICLKPSLAALDAAIGRAFHDHLERAARPADRDARTADQHLWLDGRAMACPAAAHPQPKVTSENIGDEAAVACLSRIYEQRLAVLRYARNAAAWPRTRFHPTIVEGTGTKLCEDLERDLAASFLGPGLFVNPLGEREIGFTPIPGLGNNPVVRRADIDAYNLGKPFPILQWIADKGEGRQPTVEYRAFDSPKELLGAIGRGVEPLANSVRKAAHPVIDIDRLPHLDATRLRSQPRAAFARSSLLPIGEIPRFFRYADRVYLAGPMQPVPGKPGDLGIYRLYGPARLHRVCLFDAHMPTAHSPDQALLLPEIEKFERAPGPLLPTGRLCAGIGEEARMLADHAAWRPWVLDERLRMPGGLSSEQLALFMRNRGLTGPKKARQYRAYITARAAAIEALAPFYRDEFGRSPMEAKRFAALYLDRKVSDGFELDPDDDVAAALFAPDYAEKHAAQRAALTGNPTAMGEALGPEPKAVAKGVTGKLDEPLVSDALEHPGTLRAVLELGLDPNEAGASGRPPLMIAARLDLVEAAGILLVHKAAVDTRAQDAVAQTDSTGDPLCMTETRPPATPRDAPHYPMPPS